jgi:hypothetical protein
VRARDIWRSRVRGPVEHALATAIALAVVALGSGKGEDVVAAIAGVGVLSWASLSIKKLVDFLVAQAVSIAAGFVLKSSRDEVLATLARISVPKALGEQVIDAFKPSIA